MALVHIVYALAADGMNPDTTRMGTIEDLPDELARQMAGHPNGAFPGDGTARWPSEDEIAAYQEQQAARDKAAEAVAQAGDLSKLKKADLLDLAQQRGVDADESMTKAEIVKAIEDADATSAEAGEPVPGRDMTAQPGQIAVQNVLHPDQIQPATEADTEADGEGE